MNLGLRDFFIGVVHLFVIFLPGGITLLALMYPARGYVGEVSELGISNVGASLIFLAMSYLVGHLVSLVASKVEDDYSRSFRKAELKESKAMLRRVTQDICISRLSKELVTAKSLRRWAAGIARQEGGSVQASVDSKDADRRFFRNIRFVLVFPLAVVVIENAGGEATTALIAGAIVLLMILSQFRYLDQDAKFTQVVFEVLINLEASKRHGQGIARSQATHAGGVVFKKFDRDIKFLLVKASDSDQWVLPKGHIEVTKDESVEEAAVREVYEEANEVVRICGFLDFTYFVANGERVRLANYLMTPIEGKERIALKESLKLLTEVKENREKEWHTFGDAMKKLGFPESQMVLELAEERASFVPERKRKKSTT